MAVSEFAAPAPPSLVAVSGPPGALSVRREGGRVWLGSFLIPEVSFVIKAPCPVCDGPVLCDQGDLQCMHCAREMVASEVTYNGRITAVLLGRNQPPTLVRVAPGQSRWIHRRLSKGESQNGLCARVLKLTPPGPEYTVVESLATTLAVSRDEIRQALARLVEQKLVERFTFASGYRTGFRRRPTREH
jgi:hypothetical protein